MTRFNPRARVGRDPGNIAAIATTVGFNPRARVGRDIRAPGTSISMTRFNPRARVGRDGLRERMPTPPSVFQSTRPRGARLDSSLTCWRGSRVSIHAPAWGATVVDFASGHTRVVSIHAPAWGATIDAHGVGLETDVSIHAPAWGATLPWIRPRSPEVPFQSTRPRGARPAAAGQRSAGPICFNPRARVGRDLHSAHKVAHSKSFNPRARVGRDADADGVEQLLVVSIHAPAWGATQAAVYPHARLPGFNPRARVGRDLTTMGTQADA